MAADALHIGAQSAPGSRRLLLQIAAIRGNTELNQRKWDSGELSSHVGSVCHGVDRQSFAPNAVDRH